MKKHLLLINTLLISLSTIAQVTNGDLELWQQVDLYEDFTGWQSPREFQDTNVTQVADAQDQTYSARLETVDNGGDTLFGFVLHGVFGDNGPEAGVPYNASGFPDSLIFWTKYDIVPGDVASAIIVPFIGTNAAGMDNPTWSGTNTTTWERKAFKLTTPISLDHILVAFASGDPINESALPETWIMIDNIQIKTTMGSTFLVPNHSFEDWETVSTEEPNDWYGNILYGTDTTVYKSTDAQSNTYAARVVTKVNDEGDTIQGYLSNGPTTGDEWFTAVPYTQMHTSFNFSYKYTTSIPDTAWAQIDFMENGNSVGGAYVQITSQGTYKDTSISIYYTPSAMPDSMRIIFASGEEPGSELFIDQVDLTSQTTSISTLLNETVLIFPNPAQEEITIRLNTIEENTKISILTIDGKLIETRTINSNNIQVDLSSYEKGTYIYEVSINNNIFKGKFIKL